MAADLLARIRSELEQRLEELRPLLPEYERLLAAAEALDTPEAEPSAGGTETVATTAAPAPRRRGRGRRGSAAGAIEQVASGPTPGGERRPRGRAARGAAQQAILAALGHGSHTASELVMVTAMSTPNIRGNLSRLAEQGAITKTKRDGKTAYALPATAAE